MYKLIRKNGSIRIGVIQINGKSAEAPCFFATSDFGGGGTNVSRLLVYSDIFINTNSQLLMNYYYLDINSDLSPRFDTKLVKEILKFKDINQFIQHIKKTYLFSEPKKAIVNFKYDGSKEWRPVVLLDSGSGNILRGKIKRKEITHENYKAEYQKIVKEYFDFSILNKFDMIIAIDFAGKNTLKAGEKNDQDYVAGVVEFSSNERNLELLKLTLDFMKDNKPNMHVLAPIHGNSPDEYEKYIKDILELERKENCKFSGFAIGGLGNPNKINKDIWAIPEGSNAKVKAALYLMKISSIVRASLDDLNDDRPIHILGSASPYNLIPLIFAGCDTFDCHSAWRRSSDGNERSKECVFDKIQFEKYDLEGVTVSFSKLLVPLLNSNLDVIEENKEKFLEFVNINNYEYQCGCAICKNIKLDELKKLYCGNKEENYYAKILIYLHNILQYDYICEKMRSLSNENEFKNFIESLPESQFKENMMRVLFS
ncbi:MAG: hypothetical protein KAT28_01135 [Candidatus Aenigmarchaeota archaeon]|nr:hypothetical protein [Candidatus Aenigmarchaeota archaeon]